MQIAKLNVLHLHLTDTQSFPVLLHDEEGLPLSQLAVKGSFDPSSVYSLAALRDLDVYARDRGVVIVPEIDLPAHSRSWGRAFPDLVFDPPANVNWTKRGVTEEMLPLDISSPRLLVVIAAVLKQVAREAFPLSPFLHVGGDEVRAEPWLAVPHVERWMHNQGFSSPQQAFAAFERSVIAVVEGLGKRPMVWQEALDTNVLPNTTRVVVQPWKCWGGHSLRAADAALRRGLPVVVSSCWYLDSDTDWLTLLSSDQAADALARLPPDLALAAHGQVWGGEASMWTERVDEGNFECRVWPRAAAVAARLWGWSSHPHHQGNSSVGKALDALTIAKLPTSALSHASLRSASSAGRATAVIDRRTSIALHAGLTHMRWFLSAALGVAAAPLVFFNSSSLAGPRRTARTEEEALALIRETVELPRTLTSDDKLVPPGPRMSAICPLLGQSEPPSAITPAFPAVVRAAQLNVADGAPGPRLARVSSWLRSKASAGALYVGLCELNGWQQAGLMRDRALAAGFAFSHVSSSKEQPYHVGIVASQPFTVLSELGPPTLQRALLHVHFSKPLDLHVVVAHLHAHDSGRRREEAALIVSKVLRPLLQQNKRVVLQGDLNTLAESDAPTHNKLIHVLVSPGPGYARLAKKFLTPDRTAVDYEPLQMLLRAGMIDPCTLSATANKICGATVPTNLITEADLGSASPHPALRLDYALLSPRIVQEAAAGAQVHFTTEQSDVSDHLPLSFSFS
jgi:endonuclease/exonuclease/phosphatase family metal-dependent hydrolase